MSKTKEAAAGATTPDLQAQLEAEQAQLAKDKAEAEAAAEAESVKAREEAQLALEKEEVAKRLDAATAVEADTVKINTEEMRLAAAQDEVAADAARRAKVGKRRYRAVFGRMIDPDTQKEFDTDSETKSELTSWLQFQIDNGKIVEADED